MKGAEIRQAFLDYFNSKGHEIVSSSSLVPVGDPTLLFSNAGMNQFKDLFLGAEKRSYSRATTSQKCMRVSGKHNDLENVGVTARHHTFFEMLGNFSFGDYFKRDAIAFAWEFLTETLGLERDKLWASILEGDDEAGGLWPEVAGMPPERVVALGEKDNFWAMGDTGPCGPCSEIHYYIGDPNKEPSAQGLLNDDGSFLEIWNLVFMQFNRSADGKQTPLPKPSVDTGLGLERIACIMQNTSSNYDTDLLRYVITRCEELSGFRYDGSSYEERDLKTDLDYARDVAMRVIADHSRATAFLLADGVQPASDGRGYVLRRIIRRAVRHGRVLQFKEPFLAETTATVVTAMGEQYPELKQQQDLIARMVAAEETKFHETLDSGLAVLQREVEKLGAGELFPGETAFLLHDTFGFPLDLTEDALKAYDRHVDTAAFDAAMQAQRRRSREDRAAQELSFESIKLEGAPTKFLGYETTEAQAALLQLVAADDKQSSFGQGDAVSLLFDQTPFYAEAGGQVGDRGTVSLKDAELEVTDTQKLQNAYYLHSCKVLSGKLDSKSVGQKAALQVDGTRRSRIRMNHSATHLVHSALRRVLGDHVKQAGSRVDDRSLRFDYSHFEPVTAEQLEQIQTLVNDEVRCNHEVMTREMPIDQAKKEGALALFGEKYDDVVRVLQIGPDSLELCGGTHVTRSGDIGLVLVASDTGISAGVRRIECWSGPGALAQVLDQRTQQGRMADMLKSDASDLPHKLEKLLTQGKVLEKELEQAKAQLASASSGGLVSQARTSPQGIKVIAERVANADTQTLRSMVDSLRVKLGSGVVALGAEQGDSAVIVAGVTSDLTSKVNAGKLIKEASQTGGGRGGGRADFAQAGGVDPAMLGEALDKIFELVT